MELKTTQPCPFACGGQTTYLSRRGLYYVVVCKVCGAEGPYADTAAEAVEMWDKRADPRESDYQKARHLPAGLFNKYSRLDTTWQELVKERNLLKHRAAQLLEALGECVGAIRRCCRVGVERRCISCGRLPSEYHDVNCEIYVAYTFASAAIEAAEKGKLQ